jgi:3-carboxy-cis,cis-muconate cycloisomerase
MPRTFSPSAAPARLAAVRALFSRRSLWQSWLDIEATLAEVQGELGIIPAASAAEIRSKANFDAISEDALAADADRTMAPVLSLARALSAACSPEAGSHVHWGATTQNVMQTGRTLLMRRAHAAFMERFGEMLDKLAGLAETHAETLTVARTNYRHALPVTFGFKVAGWIEEMLRHRDRFAGAEPRVFMSLWGGAVGAMHAFGEHGPEINLRLSERLGLHPMRVPSRAATDPVAEYVMLLALFSATCSKIARGLYSLMADEYSEISEQLGGDVVGSSTMPHKINSKVAVEAIALAAQLRSQVPLALEAMQPSHEGDVANNCMMYGQMETICPLAYELVDAMDEMLGCIAVDTGRMRRNLDHSADFIAAENAMMVLAPVIGRNRAHDLLHHAIDHAVAQPGSLVDELWQHDEIRGAISRQTLEEALDPRHYTGRSAEMAREMAICARLAAREIRGNSKQTFVARESVPQNNPSAEGAPQCRIA